MNNNQPGTNIGDGPLKNVKQALPPRDNQHTLRERIRSIIYPDHPAHQQSPKSDPTDALEQLVNEEVKTELQAIVDPSSEYQYEDGSRTTVKDRITQLKEPQDG